MQRNISEAINQRGHQLSRRRVGLPRTSVRRPRESRRLRRPQQWPSTATFANHNWMKLSDERMRWRTNWSWLTFLYAGMWRRTKVINFWFSHNKTCDVDLLTCNRTEQSTSLWFICCSDPCCSLKHPVRVLSAVKLQSIMFYDVFMISACWTLSHLMNFLFVSMCKTHSRQLLVITAA